jgi:hypothetical protein
MIHYHPVMLCKKLALRGDEPPSNLHAAERWFDLPIRTRTIRDDNGETIFVNEVRSKRTSSGHDCRRSPTATPTALGSQHHASSPSHASLSLRRHGYNSSPLSYLWGGPGYRVWTDSTLYIVKYNLSLIVTELYKYSTQYLTNSTLANIPPSWSRLARISTFAALSKVAWRNTSIFAIPNSRLHLQLCTLLFYHNNFCPTKLESSTSK